LYARVTGLDPGAEEQADERVGVRVAHLPGAERRGGIDELVPRRDDRRADTPRDEHASVPGGGEDREAWPIEHRARAQEHFAGPRVAAREPHVLAGLDGVREG